MKKTVDLVCMCGRIHAGSSTLWIVASVFTLLFALFDAMPAYAQAQGTMGGFLELTSVFFSEGGRQFGPGEVITISGSIPSVAWCPAMSLHNVGRGEGPFDFFPVADFYVLKDDGMPLAPGTKLEDVSGQPNRVTGLANGVFVEETVAITKPAGNLGPGRYRVVMDQCLDGYYDSSTDIVLGDGTSLGFEVLDQGSIPPINYSYLKDNAKNYSLALSGQTLSAVGLSVEVPGLCKLYGKLMDAAHLQAASNLASWGKIALDRCADLIKEQDGIAADPPDPNFTVFAELGPITYNFSPPNTPLELAARNFAHAIAEQAATSKALLASVERFQGAQVAGDDLYTLLQMRVASRYVDLLSGSGGSLLRTYAAIEALDQALAQDPLGQLQEAKDFHSFVPEIRGALGGEIQPLGPSTMRQIIGGKDTVVPIGLQAWIAQYNGDLQLAGLNGIPQVRAQNGLPPLVFHHPIARTTGPYAAPPGRAVHFDASPSSDPDGDPLTYSWDLNADGVFGDAVGSTVNQAFDQPGTRLVGVKATDPAGNSSVGYVLVRIGDVSAQDIISMPKTKELFKVSSTGQVTQLKSGVGFNSTLQALRVDATKDIFVLTPDTIEHYNSDGGLVATLSLANIQSATGVKMQSLDDFVIDGRGDLIVAGVEDLGMGFLNAGSFINFQDLPGRHKLVRLSRDGSTGSFIADVSQGYLSLQIINGVLTEFISPTGGSTGVFPVGIAIDPDGNIVVGDADYPLDAVPNAYGVVRVDPTTGALTVVFPGAVSELGYGPLSRNFIAFGATNFLISPDLGAARFTIDGNGQYIGSQNGSPSLYRMFMPLQVQDVIPPGLIVTYHQIQAFPVLLSTANSPAISLTQIAIDSGGDYVGAGTDFSGQLGSGIFRTSPIGELSKISNVNGLIPRVMDVVPLERAVTPKDIPPDPTVRVDQFSMDQQSCPGSAQLNARISNSGAGIVTQRVRVYFLDGDPEKDGVLIGSAVSTGNIAPGASIVLSAPWAVPTPGVHNLFAIVVGSNTVSIGAQVCVPAQFAANPIVLTPPSGTQVVGGSYTVTATVLDAFGNGVGGVDVAFAVSGANTATGVVTTSADGTAQFKYKGVASGPDLIVGSLFGASSKAVSATWNGAVNGPPVANAGVDRTIEATSSAGAVVNLSAAASSDPDSDPLSFIWTGPFGTLSGVSVSPAMPLGANAVTLSADDGHGHIAKAVVNITVRDTAPPVVTAPLAITIPATEASGARSSASANLAAFLNAGSATDLVDASPARLAPQAGGVDANNNTLFPIGATTAVSFRFQDFSGNPGSATSKVSVVLGVPKLSGVVVAHGTDATGYFVDVQVTNTGTGNGRDLSILQIDLRALSGTGAINNVSKLPISIDNLDVGMTMKTRIYIQIPSTVLRLALTEGGTIKDVVGTQYSFSMSQSFIP